MTIGDLIMGVRALGPDPCQMMGAPTVGTLGQGAGGTFPASSQIFLMVTASTIAGESLPSAESSVVLAGTNNAIMVPVSFSPGAVSVRVYYGSATGAENGYEQFTIPGGQASPYTVTVLNSPIAGFPPASSSAYLPDSDGGFVSASAMYRWLNETLKAAARAAGGIQDTCGIASVSGQRRYVAPGQWLRFTHAFYDGWEQDLGNVAETFRNRNLTANISISFMVDAQSDTTRVELYWTPSRTSGATTTSGILAAIDSNVSINPATGWLLADGMAQVGAEIVSYSAITSTLLQNIIRGWNGTRAAASLAIGAAVKELNIELTGYRMPATYAVGDSAVTLGVPPGWEPFLKDYMLGLFRDAEQERQEAQALKDGATKGLEAWAKSNKPVAGPRQCRMYGDTGIRGLVPGGLSGGIIIP